MTYNVTILTMTGLGNDITFSIPSDVEDILIVSINAANLVDGLTLFPLSIPLRISGSNIPHTVLHFEGANTTPVYILTLKNLE